jgi:hypothetical protein
MVYNPAALEYFLLMTTKVRIFDFSKELRDVNPKALGIEK